MPVQNRRMGRQETGDLDVIRKRIELWLQQRFPQRPGLRVGELVFPEASGESSVTLMLDATWPDGAAEKFVLRMVPKKSHVFATHDLLMQFQMMAILQREGLPAPPLIGYEADPELLGSDFYVMGCVAGRIPPDNPPMVFASWVSDELDAAQRTTMWANGLETLSAIHRIDVTEHDIRRLPRAGAGEPLVAHDLRRFDAMFTPALRAGTDAIVVEAWQFLQQHPPADGTPVLCWGDARAGNVIWRDLMPVAVLDWEMANYGDARCDVAWWMWIDKCMSEGLGMPRLTGLPEPRDVYARWSALTGLAADGMAYFELFAAVRFAIILELKFVQMRASHPEMADMPNFAGKFVPELLEKAAATR